MVELTNNQKFIWNFIQDFLYQNQSLPKINTIAKEFGMTYSGMRDHLVLMEKKGYVEFLKGSRGGYILKRYNSKMHNDLFNKERLDDYKYWKMYCYLRFLQTSRNRSL